MAPTSGVGGSNSAAAAAAQARARAAAEARARAAAEARARAAAQAKAQAAAQAKAQAQTQRKTAAQAQNKARSDSDVAQKAQKANEAAQQKKTTAQQELTSAKSALDSHNQTMDQRGPRPNDPARTTELKQQVKEAQEKFDKANTAATRIQEATQKAVATAATSRRDALTQANAALQTQKAANTAAKDAGEPEPFTAANTVRDAYDAGSLDAKAQEQLFGAQTVVTQEEAVRADAQSVADATARSPREGAEELNRQLQGSTNPDYRSALAQQITPSAEKITASLRDPATTPENAAAIVKSMASNADLVGPGARSALAGQLNKAAGAPDDKDGQKVRDALRANAGDSKTLALGAEMAGQLRSANKYADANAITNLSPEFKTAAPENAKDVALQAEVDLNTVADERTHTQEAQKESDTEARAHASQIFEMAARPTKDLPPGVSVEPGSTPDHATLVTKDEQGNVTSRITAEREGNKVTLDSTQYDGQGAAQRSIVSSDGPEGTTSITQASWKETPSATPAAPPSIEDLKKSRDPNVALSETTVSHDGGTLVQSSYVQDSRSGVTQSEKRFGTQDNKDGITDRLDGNFHDGPVDKVDVKTTNIPPPGAKGPDGKDAKASVTSGTSYSQDDVRITAAETRVVDSPANGQQPNADDLGETANRADDADDPPKSWTLEKSKPNELDTQTFVEGQTDLSVVTRKKVEGNSVTETTEGKVPDPGGGDDPVEVRGTSSRTYNDTGQLTASHTDQTDATGTHRVQDYQRTESHNAEGELEVTDHTSVSEQAKDGPLRTVDQEQTSVQTDQGPELVRASQAITTPDGVARATITPEGQDLTLNGQTVKDPEALNALPTAQSELASSAVAGLSQQVSDFSATATQLHTALAEQQQSNDGHETAAAKGANSYGLYRLQKSVTTGQANSTGNPSQDPSGTKSPVSREPKPSWVEIKPQPGQALPSVTTNQRIAGGAAGGAQLASSVAGLVTSGRALFNDIQQGNLGKAALDGLGLALNGVGAYGGFNAALSAIKGTSGGLTLGGKIGTAGGRINPSVVGELAGKLSAGLGVVFGGIEVYQGIKNGNGWQIASGVVTAGAAVGGYLAVGAAAGAWGGPAGALVGLGIGALAFGVTKLFDWFDDSEHDVASQQI